MGEYYVGKVFQADPRPDGRQTGGRAQGLKDTEPHNMESDEHDRQGSVHEEFLGIIETLITFESI